MVSEPDGCLETFGERFAGMAFLAEISDEKACDTGIIVNDQELGTLAG
jgi:hypothetical protein